MQYALNYNNYNTTKNDDYSLAGSKLKIFKEKKTQQAWCSVRSLSRPLPQVESITTLLTGISNLNPPMTDTDTRQK